MIAKFAVISIALTLCFSSPLMAKDHANKGNKINSNKQQVLIALEVRNGPINAMN